LTRGLTQVEAAKIMGLDVDIVIHKQTSQNQREGMVSVAYV